MGNTNTGKSTIVDVICAMFAPGVVGVFDATHEKIFGLQYKYEKELIIAPEIDKKMVRQLSSDVFKKMITGELVNIPRKCSKATSVEWKVPMFMCGTNYLNYRGFISEMLAVFTFDKDVSEVDSTLKCRILKTELAKIIIKALSAYRTLRERIGDRGFWDVCPDYFKDNRDAMSESTDYIHMFLSLGPDNNTYPYFIRDAGSHMLLEEFKNQFSNWMKLEHPGVRHRWTRDCSAFARKGFEIVRIKICKMCKQESHINCCEYYDNANRTTRVIIKNIRCINNRISFEQTFTS